MIRARVNIVRTRVSFFIIGISEEDRCRQSGRELVMRAIRARIRIISSFTKLRGAFKGKEGFIAKRLVRATTKGLRFAS